MLSVLDQNYPGLEYIVMDGGSRDGSRDIIEKYAGRLAYWVSEKDAGQTDALKRGFDRSTGEIMGWLCSDDLLLPGSLEAVAQYFAANPEVDVVFGDAIWIDGEGKPIRAKREMGFNKLVFCFDHNYLPQPSVFWRRSVYEAVGGLTESFNLAMDSDLWERFSRKTDIRHCGQYWSAIRSYAEQKTQALRPAGRVEDSIIRSRHRWGANASLARPLRALARGVRIASRLALGAYTAPVPDNIRAELARYEINRFSRMALNDK